MTERFTIVYTAEDNGQQSAYGLFSSRLGAEKRRDLMDASLDPDRDPSWGGVGNLQVVRVRPLVDWE